MFDYEEAARDEALTHDTIPTPPSFQEIDVVTENLNACPCTPPPPSFSDLLPSFALRAPKAASIELDFIHGAEDPVLSPNTLSE